MPPPQLARDAPVADVVHPLDSKSWHQLSGTNSMRPLSTASIAFSASGFIFTNHCVETSGSTTSSQRSHFADAERCNPRSSTSTPDVSRVRHHPLARFEAVEPRIRAGRGRHARIRRRSPESAAGCGACRLRNRWDRARASSSPRRCRTSDRPSRPAMIGNLAVHQRQPDCLAMQVAIARVLRVDRDRGIAQHGLRARGRDARAFSSAPITG